MNHALRAHNAVSRRRFGLLAGAAGLGASLAPAAPVFAAAPSAPSAPAAFVEPAAPVLAWYYPQFSQGAQADVAGAARAGIDAIVLSQTGHEPGQRLSAAPIYQAAESLGAPTLFATGFEITMYPDQAAVVAELRRILAEDATDPRFLRHGGRPVLIFWALPAVPTLPGQSRQAAWQSIRDQVDPDRGTIWIAEGGDTNASTGTLSYLPAFDGLHLYSVAWAADPAGALGGWANRLRGYDASKLWVATVMPGGHWGAGTDPSQWSYRDRAGGAYLSRAWQGAIATGANMVIVTSFNETRERTEIHPTGEWGDFYLDLTRQLGDHWRGAMGAAPYGA